MGKKRGRVFKVLGMILGVVILVSALMFPACKVAEDEELPTVHWNYHSLLGADCTMNVRMAELFDEMTEFTEGRFTVTIYPTGTLGFSSMELWDTIGRGLVDIGEVWNTHITGRYPFIDVAELPFLYNRMDGELNNRVCDLIFDDLAEPLLEDNLVTLAYMVYPGGQGLISREPLNLAEPEAILKGLKVRVCGVVTEWVIEALGGSAVFMDWTEIYLGLQRGIVDAADVGPTEACWSMHFQEVADYVVYLDAENWKPLSTLDCTVLILVNKDEFDDLPSAWQEKLVELMREWQDTVNVETVGDLIEDARWGVEEYGLTVVEIPAESIEYLEAKAPEYWEAWLANAGPYGQALLDKILEELGK